MKKIKKIKEKRKLFSYQLRLMQLDRGVLFFRKKLKLDTGFIVSRLLDIIIFKTFP